MLDGREDFYSAHLFLILKFATRKITTIPACPQHLLLQTRPALPQPGLHEFSLLNAPVLAPGYCCSVPLYQSLQTSVLRWAEMRWQTENSGGIALRMSLYCWSRRAAHEQLHLRGVFRQSFLQQVPHANNWSWSTMYVFLYTRLLLLRNIYHPKPKILP